MEDKFKNKYQLILYVIGIIALLAGFFWFIGQIKMIANILAVSILVTYLIAPAVHWLTDRKVSKPLAIVIVYCALAVIIGFCVSYLLPIVKTEFQRLVSNMHSMGLSLHAMIDSWAATIQGWLPESMKPMIDPSKINGHELMKYIQNETPSLVQNTAPGFMQGMRSMASVLTGAILVPLLVFYILMDAQTYKESFVGCLPKRWRTNAVDLLRRIDFVLGKFISGQLIVCVTIGFFVAASLWLLGIDYALLIGFFSGVVDVIPYVGVGISYIPAFIIALLNKGPLFAIFTILILQVVHWLEGHIIVPAVIGRSVKLPPLTVMVALIAGAELGGILGMLFAIPLTAIARVAIEFYVEKHPDFGPLSEEDMKVPDTPYPPDPNAIVPARESVKQIMGKVQDSRLAKHLRRYNSSSHDDVPAVAGKDSGQLQPDKADTAEVLPPPVTAASDTERKHEAGSD